MGSEIREVRIIFTHMYIIFEGLSHVINVPDRRSLILEVVIVRHLITWVLGIWRGEGLGKGLRKGRSVYKQPETKVDGSVPDRRCRNYPEVVLVRRWVIRVLGIWRGRVWGKGGTREVSLQAT